MIRSLWRVLSVTWATTGSQDVVGMIEDSEGVSLVQEDLTEESHFSPYLR